MKYPASRLPKAISMSLEGELLSRKYGNPNLITITPALSYAYYMPGILNKVAFVIETPLLLSKKAFDPNEIFSEASRRIEKDGYCHTYLAYWGSWNGDQGGPRSGKVNTNKTEKKLEPGNSVIRCYVNRTTLEVQGEVLFNPIDMPPAIPNVDLSDRERTLMFIFGKLKDGYEQRLALDKLKVSSNEIQDLVKKQALRANKRSYSVTLAGLVSQLEKPQPDKW